MTDVLVMYGEMARTIAGQMKVKLSLEDETRLSGAIRVNAEAYDAYLKGLFHWYKLTRLDLDSALGYFELALAKDPGYARAHVGIAHVWLARLMQGDIPASEAVPKSQAAALRALELDPSLAEVHHLLGIMKMNLDWDWKSAEKEFRQAIELNPKYPDPRAYYSHLLYILKRPKEAMEQIEKALELDPLNALFQAIYAMDLMYAHRYDDAIVVLRDTLKATPNHPVALSALRSAYHMTQRYNEALEIWKASYAARGDKEAVEALTQGFAKGGYKGALRRVAETFVARSRTTFVTPWQIGTLYTRAGMNKEALDWLEKAYEAHDPNSIYLGVDPIFDILREEPRFQDILRQMKLR
jgi:tetratricopeptide (TPR) repeat protein